MTQSIIPDILYLVMVMAFRVETKTKQPLERVWKRNEMPPTTDDKF